MQGAFLFVIGLHNLSVSARSPHLSPAPPARLRGPPIPPHRATSVVRGGERRLRVEVRVLRLLARGALQAPAARRGGGECGPGQARWREGAWTHARAPGTERRRKKRAARPEGHVAPRCSQRGAQRRRKRHRDDAQTARAAHEATATRQSRRAGTATATAERSLPAPRARKGGERTRAGAHARCAPTALRRRT